MQCAAQSKQCCLHLAFPPPPSVMLCTFDGNRISHDCSLSCVLCMQTHTSTHTHKHTSKVSSQRLFPLLPGFNLKFLHGLSSVDEAMQGHKTTQKLCEYVIKATVCCLYSKLQKKNVVVFFLLSDSSSFSQGNSSYLDLHRARFLVWKLIILSAQRSNQIQSGPLDLHRKTGLRH